MDEWAERVQEHELKHALRQLHKGQDIDAVMEQLSHRIQKKMLHPVFIDIKSNSRKRENK